MRSWLAEHRSGLSSAVRRIARSPLSTLANVMVIGASVALPLVGVVSVRYLDRVVGDVTGHPVLNVFLALDAGRGDAARIEGIAKGGAGVTRVRFVSKDAALDRLKGVDGLSDAIAALRSNPLPDAVIIDIDRGRAIDGDRLAALLRKTEKVAYVQWDDALHRRAATVLGIGRGLLATFGALLGIALVAVTFNTVRLQILSAAEEVVLTRLVGATDRYIRRPFCYYGLILGLIGGATGLGLASLVIRFLLELVESLAKELGSAPSFGGLIMVEMASAVGAAAALGLLGAYLSVSAHLRSILRPV